MVNNESGNEYDDDGTDNESDGDDDGSDNDSDEDDDCNADDNDNGNRNSENKKTNNNNSKKNQPTCDSKVRGTGDGGGDLIVHMAGVGAAMHSTHGIEHEVCSLHDPD